MPSSAIIVCGLGYGDESKGATTDFLTRQFPVDLIVRYNGGSQAAHSVVTPQGVHHTFSQFGAGMLANASVRTHLSRFMLVDPLTMMNEGEALEKKTEDPWGRTTVDGHSVIITPFHKRLNRLREQSRRGNRHGSCGMGVGAARELHLRYQDEVILAEDLRGGDERWIDIKLRSTALLMIDEIHRLELEQGYPLTDVSRQCAELARLYCEWPAIIVDRFTPGELMVFEGAQGVLLDETHGDAPFNTWTDTTFLNADILLDEVGVLDRFRLGCTRTYHTRHGAGPLPGEDAALRALLPEPHNATDPWQGEFRVSRFDWSLAERSRSIVGALDGLAVSHLDVDPIPALSLSPSHHLQGIADAFDAPVLIAGHGPTASDRTWTESASRLHQFAGNAVAA